MPGKQRTRHQVAADRAEIAEMLHKGYRLMQIAHQLGRSFQHVQHDIAAIEKEWAQRQVGTVEQWRTRQLDEVAELKRVYWTTWERSLKIKQLLLVEETSVPPLSAGPRSIRMLGRRKTAIRIEQGDGNLDALRGIQWCMEREAKLLGIDDAAHADQELRRMLRKLADASGMDYDALVGKAEQIAELRWRATASETD